MDNFDNENKDSINKDIVDNSEKNEISEDVAKENTNQDNNSEEKANDGENKKEEYNKFDKFCIKIWNYIKKGLNISADFINNLFNKIFKKKFPTRYIKAGIISLLLIIFFLIIGLSTPQPEGSNATLFVYSEDSLYAVQNSDGDWGYVNGKGKEKIEFKFDSATIFVDNRAMVSEVFIINGVSVSKYGIINTRGKYINEEKYDFASEFDKDGYAMVKKDNKFGVVGTDGKVKGEGIIFDNIGAFNEGYCWVMIGANYGFIDHKGYIVSPKYSNCHNFSEGLAAVRNNDGKWGFINTKGKEVIECQFDNVFQSFIEGYSIVGYNVKDANNVVIGFNKGIINKNGKFELVAKYSNIDVRIDSVED